MKPGLIIVQLKVFSNICQSGILSVKAFFRDRRTLSMKMMKLGMRSVPLGNMMSELSRAAALSKNYTSHCIRVTAISALDRAGYEARHMMTVSGHQNEASIMSYSRDTSTDQKRQMSETISYIIPGSTENEVNVPSEAKTDHGDNSLQGGIDDFVSLSASQTEIMLEEINTY